MTEQEMIKLEMTKSQMAASIAAIAVVLDDVVRMEQSVELPPKLSATLFAALRPNLESAGEVLIKAYKDSKDD